MIGESLLVGHTGTLGKILRLVNKTNMLRLAEGAESTAGTTAVEIDCDPEKYSDAVFRGSVIVDALLFPSG